MLILRAKEALGGDWSFSLGENPVTGALETTFCVWSADGLDAEMSRAALQELFLSLVSHSQQLVHFRFLSCSAFLSRE